MVKYAKMDPKDSPAKMMVSTIGGPSGGDMGNMISELIELGLIVDNVNGKMIVVDVITEIESVFIGTQPDNDDQLIKIQSQNIKSVEHLSQIYENIKAGDKASMTMLRNGEEITLEFKKPNADQCPLKTKVMKKQGQ
ncbi:MAG: hypothetical protein GY865_18205, partial [candidate division Zixibacteria bacterium]|nr:hypothetical protein [candidate division Zixibacteria bacterium]